MTCKMCCNLTHLIDRPICRPAQGGSRGFCVSIYGNAPPPPLDPPTPCFLRKYHETVDFSALFNNMWTCLWSVCRLKPIKPIEMSIGARIQDPRSKIVQRSVGRILDPGLLKPIEPIEISIGTKIQDPRFPGKTPEQSWILDRGPD